MLVTVVPVNTIIISGFKCDVKILIFQMSTTLWSKECEIKYYTIQYNRYAISMPVKSVHFVKTHNLPFFDTHSIFDIRYTL